MTSDDGGSRAATRGYTPRDMRGPKDAATVEEYNAVLSFPPVDRAEILQTAGGSLSVMARTVPFQALGTSVLAATRFARRPHLNPALQAPEVSGGDTRGGGVAGKGGGGGGPDILRIGAQAARSPAACSPGQLSGALRRQTNKSVSFTQRHRQPLSAKGVSPFLGSPLLGSPLGTPGSRGSRTSSSRGSRRGKEPDLDTLAATVWWLDDQQFDIEHKEWVKVSERVRPSTPERSRIAFALNRQREAHMRRIEEYHRAGNEAVDNQGKSLLPPIQPRFSLAT